jgi:hypothetical protein
MRVVYVLGGVVVAAILMHGGHRAAAQQTGVPACDAPFIREAPPEAWRGRARAPRHGAS